MFSFDYQQAESEVLSVLGTDSRLGQFVDPSRLPPKPFWSGGAVKLIVLAQDPTKSSAASTSTTVLDLDRGFELPHYVRRLVRELGFELQEVYATNLVKNYFKEPPSRWHEVETIREFEPVWRPLLARELGEFPCVPMLLLGQPVLKAVDRHGDADLRDYWGYTSPHTLDHLRVCDTDYRRAIFPFPHLNTTHTPFYGEVEARYLRYVRNQLGR